MKLHQYLTENSYRWTFLWMKEYNKNGRKTRELRHADDFSFWEQKYLDKEKTKINPNGGDKLYMEGKVRKTKPSKNYNGRKISADYKLFIRYEVPSGEAIIDIDEKDVFKAKHPQEYAAAEEQQKNTPYYLSRNKRLPHIFVTTDYKGTKKIGGSIQGFDFLTNCFIWAKADEELINYDKDIAHESIDYIQVLGGASKKSLPISKNTTTTFQKRPLVQELPVELIGELFGLGKETPIIPPDKCDNKWNWMCLAKILQQHFPEKVGRELFDDISTLSIDAYGTTDNATGLKKKECCDAYYNIMSHDEKCKATIIMLYRWALDADPTAFNSWKLRWSDILNLPTNFARNKPFNMTLLKQLCASIKNLATKDGDESKQKRQKQLQQALEYFSCYAYQVDSPNGCVYGLGDFHRDGTSNPNAGISHSYNNAKAFKECWKDRGYAILLNPKNGKRTSLIDAWIQWIPRRHYEGVIFNPVYGEQQKYQDGVSNYLNLFDGLEYQWDEDFWLKYEPIGERADYTKDMKKHLKLTRPFRNFLKEVVCSNRNNCYEFLLKFLKGILCGRKLQCCVCLLGDKGTGKTFLFEKIMCSLLGKKYFLSLGGGSYDALLKEKNAYFKNKLMVIWDEAGKFRGNRMVHNQQLEDAFKKVITQEKQLIRELYKDGYTLDDFITHIILSNDYSAVPIQSESRRFWIMEMLNKYAKNKKYWDKMYKHHGFGYDDSQAVKQAQHKLVMKHIFHFLMSQDITGFRESQFPLTEETIQAKRLGIFTTDKFLYWYAKNNPYKQSKKTGGRYVKVKDLYEDYERFCIALSATNVKGQHDFSRWCHSNNRARRIFGKEAKLTNGCRKKLIATIKECDLFVKDCEKRWDLPEELKELQWDLDSLDEESEEEEIAETQCCEYSDDESDDDVTIDSGTESEEEKPVIKKKLSKEFEVFNKNNIIIPVKVEPDSDDSSDEESDDSSDVEIEIVKQKPILQVKEEEKDERSKKEKKLAKENPEELKRLKLEWSRLWEIYEKIDLQTDKEAWVKANDAQRKAWWKWNSHD